ncbi:MAG: hypothetical protein QUS33_12080 [Dehalococcoidia bacterium]|nr:hypothetical protein [Dehalococcoidia bacterium]
MLRRLPEPVRRYLNYTNVVGKPWINTVRLRQTGRFRTAPDKPWMPMTAVQFYTTDPPGFLWKARFRIFGLPLLSARDTYKAGHGHMYGRIALFTIFDERGDQYDQGSLMRYLSEMIWFPIAFLGENIVWQSVDDHCAQVTLTDCGQSVSGRLFFDDTGRPTGFAADRYYRKGKDDLRLEHWSTPISEYGVRAGLNLPVRGQAVWKLASGDYAYWDGLITEVEYNGTIERF